MSCVCQALASVHCYLVVTCWERADRLALVFYIYCLCVSFPCNLDLNNRVTHTFYLDVYTSKHATDFCLVR